MKILLDECLPVDFRFSFLQHDAHTVEWFGFKGKKTRIAEGRRGCRLRCPSDSGPRRTSPEVSCVKALHHTGPLPTNQLEDLLPLVSAITQALETIRPGQTVVIAA